MDVVIEWSDEPLNLAAVRAVLQEGVAGGEGRARPQEGAVGGEVKGDAADEGQARSVPPGGDLPAGLL